MRLHRQQSPGAIFYVTKCLEPRKPVLSITEGAVLEHSLKYFVEKEGIQIGSYVLMPDHFHVCAALTQEWSVTRWMHSLMTFVGSRTWESLGCRGCRWQENFFDTKIRSERQLRYVMKYIEANPVRANLVRYPEDWHTTSAKRHPWVGIDW